MPIHSSNARAKADSSTNALASADSAENKLDTIRALLTAPERTDILEVKRSLTEIEERLNDTKRRISDASDIMVPAVSATLAKDQQLSSVLKPVLVEQNLK